MKHLAIALILLLAGCSAAPTAPAGLKEACDAVRGVLSDFGQAAPTTQRYADVAAKVKAIQDRADATTKEALQPLLDVFNKGAQGATSEVLADQVSATMALVMTCAAAGAPLMPSTSPAASQRRAEAPVSDCQDRSSCTSSQMAP